LRTGISKFLQPEDLLTELPPKALTAADDESFDARKLGFKVETIEHTLLETNGNVPESGAHCESVGELSASDDLPRDREKALSNRLRHHCRNDRRHGKTCRHHCGLEGFYYRSHRRYCGKYRQHCLVSGQRCRDKKPAAGLITSIFSILKINSGGP